jgi:hypothetical protein
MKSSTSSSTTSKSDADNKTQTVPAELKKLIDSVTYPAVPQKDGMPSDVTGNYADHQARRVQNNIISEYYQSLHYPSPPLTLKEYGGEYLPNSTYYGKGYTPPSNVPRLNPPIAPKGNH